MSDRNYRSAWTGKSSSAIEIQYYLVRMDLYFQSFQSGHLYLRIIVSCFMQSEEKGKRRVAEVDGICRDDCGNRE